MPSVIKLDEECTIYQAAQLRQQLADALIATDSLALDLSAVIEMDCSAAQVLLWLQSEAVRLQKNLSLQHLSAEASDLLRMLGLLALLPVAEDKEASNES